jgi:DedD protein
LAQDEYYYEIQLTNKQLVFYFMAGASFLVLSFLAGIVVGRGVDGSAELPVQRIAAEDVVTREEPPARSVAPPAEQFNYSNLESDKPDTKLEKPKTAALSPPLIAEPPASAKASSATTTKKPEAATSSTKAAEKPAVNTRPAPPIAPIKSAAVVETEPDSGAFAIQVGAFKDRASADTIVNKLKGKGYAAYVIAPQGMGGGLFNVRVGSYGTREPAEKTSARLRDEEKFKPFIVKQ